MKHISLFVEQTGKGLAPRGWYREKVINIQRLYYIKSGKGCVIEKDGNRLEFRAGNIYIFPFNYHQNFLSDADDPIDHLYVDFISTPPILSDSILIYPVGEGTAIYHMVQLLDSLFKERSYELDTRIDPSAHFSRITDAPSGSHAEYHQTLYNLILALLSMLSSEREIPFADDKKVAMALKYIHQNYNKPIKVEDIAEQLDLHVNHFIRRFKAVVGVSPYSYIRTYRLYRATDLISGGMKISEAAEAVGYENASSLSRAMSKARRNKK